MESGTDCRLVDGLAERFAVTVLARRLSGAREISQPPSTGIVPTFGPSSRARFATFVYRTLRSIQPRYDAVLVQGYGPAALAANLASRTTGIPTTMLVCSPVEEYYRCRRDAQERSKPFRRHELWALQLLARTNALLGRQYVVLSRHLADVVRGHGARRPVHIIPIYGVDTTLFRPPERPRAELRASLGLPTNGSIVFFSSRVAPEKDAATMLAACGQLLKRGCDLWLLHLSGGYREFLAAAREHGVEARVIARDAVDPRAELARFYQASDLCVQASRAEGLGFSPLEAMACETPVVAAGVGGLRETVIEGQTGWTYPPGDVTCLAEAIRRAIDDRVESERRARSARTMVTERYDRRLVFDRLADLLERNE